MSDFFLVMVDHPTPPNILLLLSNIRFLGVIFNPPPLCFEWGFMWTFPGNQDVAVKQKFEVIYVKFW